MVTLTLTNDQVALLFEILDAFEVDLQVLDRETDNVNINDLHSAKSCLCSFRQSLELQTKNS